MGPGIQPRYEFRAWAPELPEVKATLESASECVQTLESTEIYLVTSEPTQANPKVRRGALEVKLLLEVRDGFELWEPRANELFPVPDAVAADVLFRWLEAPAFALPRDRYTLAELLDEVVARCASVTAVEVTKVRRAYVVDGCLAEIADVTVAGTEMQTAALESTEIPPLQRACRALGVADFTNTSYPTAIKQILQL